MKAALLSWVILFCSITMGNAQGNSGYFVKYGFRTPDLKKGEYVISLGGNYDLTKRQYNYPDSEDQTNIRGEGLVAAMHVTYALSSSLLVKAGLGFYPAIETYNFQRLSSSRQYSDKRDKRLNPDFEIAYKPSSRIEMFFDYSFYNETVNHRTISDDPSTSSFTEENIYYDRIEFGINFIGKL